jgi:hypothetical protein
MIIFNRRIKWDVLHETREVDVMVSVNIYNQVFVEIGTQSVLFNNQEEALDFGIAIMKAAGIR